MGLWAAVENGLCCVFLLREAPSGPADHTMPSGADSAMVVPLYRDGSAHLDGYAGLLIKHLSPNTALTI